MKGLATRQAQLAEARRLGLFVTPVNRTGEVRVSCDCPPMDESGHTPVRCNNRRHSGTPAVEMMLRAHRRQKEHIA